MGKRSTIQLCLTILHKINLLNRNDIILGDINPANILVVSPNEVYFVDCDSYQVAGFPCPVGTAHFTAPEAAGKNFGEFLRTQEMENFAIATLLFMIMLPGKPPYSAVGGSTPQKNIANGNFPYPFEDNDADNTPPGKWGFIWNQMAFAVKKAFGQTFQKGEKHFSPKNRLSVTELIGIFEKYQHDVELMATRDEMALAIFPTRLKKNECKSCGSYYVPDREKYSPFCPNCRAKLHGHHNYAASTTPRRTIASKRRCTFCGELKVNASQPPEIDYCYDCRNKVVEKRVCVNCLKEFPVTASLKSWENRSGFKQNQCPTCKDAHCVGSPCKHAAKQATAPSNTPKAPKSTTAAKASSTSKTSTNNKPSGRKWWVYNPYVWLLVILCILTLGYCASTSTTSAPATTSASNQQGQKKEAAMDFSEAAKKIKAESQEISYNSFRANCEQSLTELSPSANQGDIVAFGTYPEASDGAPAPLLWQVHAVEGGYATLISIFAIDAQPYDTLEHQETTDYSLSSLSYWLDSDFRAAAFTEEEESRLLPYGCAGAICKVGLMENNLSDGMWMFTYHTPYAIAQGATDARNATLNGSSFTGGCDYWIASESNSAEALYVAGDVNDGRMESCNYIESIVPVIKVALAS